MIVSFGNFMRGVYKGTILDDFEFGLLEKNLDGDVVEVKKQCGKLPFGCVRSCCLVFVIWL